MATPDPLALESSWNCGVPLIGFEEALEQSVFRSGLTRSDWLQRLAHQLHRPQLLPLLWLLPRGWKLAPAALPERLRNLAGLLERGLLSPGLLAALADELTQVKAAQPSATRLWRGESGTPGPRTLEALLALSAEDVGAADTKPAAAGEDLSGGLLWHNAGLSHEQSAAERRRNTRTAQVLNRLGANLQHGNETWTFEGCSSASQWLRALEQDGWQIKAQLRCSVASFGFGACLKDSSGAGWRQVPLALPMRTGLLGPGGQELQSLLPHSCLEMSWEKGDVLIRLQYYQGTEGFCGWEGLNDLSRPWQNDRRNGTVHYLGEPWSGERLWRALDLCDVAALVHNTEGDEGELWLGGYGALGFCIDSSALLQQALDGRCDLFPVLLGGIWRERLLKRCTLIEESTTMEPAHAEALQSYRRALLELPFDGSAFGAAALAARARLLRCQPKSSPFVLVGQLNALASTASTID